MTPNVVGRSVFILCQLLALVLSAGDGLAQTGSLQHSPSDVVKRYLALDYKGARLDAMSLETVASYTSWNEEPTWGHVVVTRGFVVAEQYRQWEVIDRLEVVIPVTFQVIGSVYWETAGFVQEGGTEEVRFRVKARETEKIIGSLMTGKKRVAKELRRTPWSDVEERLQKRLGTKVLIQKGKRGGKIVIHYFSPPELDGILETLLN
jgi:hypothetical protein